MIEVASAYAWNRSVTKTADVNLGYGGKMADHARNSVVAIKSSEFPYSKM